MSKGRLALVVSSLMFIAFRVCAGEFPADWTFDDDAKMRAEHAAFEGKPIRPLDVSGWIGGAIKADDMKGKVVVIDFYASWCGPCMNAIPHNNQLVEKYKDKGLVLFGVCTNEKGQENMAEVAKSHNMKYPTAADPKLISQKNWAVHYYPTYAVVDRKGIVRIVGLAPDHLDDVVQKLLAEPAP